jgi:hypothetical protein
MSKSQDPIRENLDLALLDVELLAETLCLLVVLSYLSLIAALSSAVENWQVAQLECSLDICMSVIGPSKGLPRVVCRYTGATRYSKATDD